MGNKEEPLFTRQEIYNVFAAVCVFALAIGGVVKLTNHYPIHDDGLWQVAMAPPAKPEIELVSMEFTVLNITETHLSAKWDLSIRIPYVLPDAYICRQGDLQASILYNKNFTLATSSSQKYKDLHYHSPQLLKISAVVSDEDISGVIGKYIMEDIKDKKEVHFRSQLFLTDCRKNAGAIMSFACDEATLRFEPGSEMKATLVGNHPTCVNF